MGKPSCTRGSVKNNAPRFCKICGEIRYWLDQHVLLRHWMTVKEYKEEYCKEKK